MRLKDMVRMASVFASAGDERRHFSLGAIGIRQDGAIVTARNEPTRVRNPCAHAEARLVRKLGKNAPLVIVVRVTKNGQLAMAKPCHNCERALRFHKVQKVFYSTECGMEELKLE